jgi:hypothetical protein
MCPYMKEYKPLKEAEKKILFYNNRKVSTKRKEKVKLFDVHNHFTREDNKLATLGQKGEFFVQEEEMMPF